MKSRSKKTPELPPSPALTCIQAAYESMPYGISTERYRHGMWKVLEAAVTSGMRFEPDDFAKMKNPALWCGRSGNDEVLYGLACGADRNTENTSAAIAMEKWFERPAVLWAEKTKTPERLYVGSKFTWDGRVVQITSMRDDSLVACTYTAHSHSGRNRAEVGTFDYFDGDYRKVLQRKDAENGNVFIEFGPADKTVSHSGVIEKRYTVKYAALAAARKIFDERRRRVEKQIKEAMTLERLSVVAAAASREGRGFFHHFDIEILREAVSAARKRIKEAMSAVEVEAEKLREEAAEAFDLKRWMRGEDVHRHFNELRVRVKDGYVETTTGQRATVESVRKLLPFIQLYRRKKKEWVRNDPDAPSADLHPLRRIELGGVLIGCTYFPWAEVDRAAAALKA